MERNTPERAREKARTALLAPVYDSFEAMLADADASIYATLRQKYPHLAWSRCDASIARSDETMSGVSASLLLTMTLAWRWYAAPIGKPCRLLALACSTRPRWSTCRLATGAAIEHHGGAVAGGPGPCTDLSVRFR